MPRRLPRLTAIWCCCGVSSKRWLRHGRPVMAGGFTIRGHFVFDKCTGEVPRNTVISTCRVD
jgi:hypothetical protein